MRDKLRNCRIRVIKGKERTGEEETAGEECVNERRKARREKMEK